MSENIEKEDNDKEASNNWITYVTRNSQTAKYNTYTEQYNKDAPEHDVMPNNKSFLALFKGDDMSETISKANDFIKQQQDIENRSISFEKIRDLCRARPQESYVIFPDGKGYRLKGVDEMKKEGLI
jgi:hypothetical protein